MSDAFALKSDEYVRLGICSSGSRRGYVKAQEVGGKLVSGIRAKCHRKTRRHLLATKVCPHTASTIYQALEPAGAPGVPVLLVCIRTAFGSTASGWQFSRAGGAESNQSRDAPSRMTTQRLRPTSSGEPTCCWSGLGTSPSPETTLNREDGQQEICSARRSGCAGRGARMLPGVWPPARRTYGYE